MPYSFEVKPSGDDMLSIVTVFGEGSTIIDQYHAYAVPNGMSLREYLSNPEEIAKAAIVANGRFTLQGEINPEDHSQAYFLSAYASGVVETREKDISQRFARSGAAAYLQKAQAHYETLRPVVEAILEVNPNMGDQHIAQRLNKAGYKAVNGGPWYATSVGRLMHYLQPTRELGGRGK